MQCVVVRCSVLFKRTRLPTATHCNTLQHTATHCNTLQHTATHCNTLRDYQPGKTTYRCPSEKRYTFVYTRKKCTTLQSKTNQNVSAGKNIECVFFVFIESFFWFVFSTGFLFRVMRRLISREKMHVYHNNNHIQRYTHTHINLWCNWCTCTCVHTCTQDFSWLFGCVQVYVCVCVLTRCTSVLRWKWGSR